MFQKIVITAIFLTLHLGVQAQTSLSAKQAAILQQKLDSCVAAFDLPGISASIINSDGDYWNGVSGLSQIYTLDSMNTEHLFYQASVTKMFVATVILQLIEENLIALDDSVGMYLPVISTVPSDTKIRCLLNHRSGIYDVFSNAAARNNWYAAPQAVWNPQDVIETYNSNPLFAQGTSFLYSNTNYLLLGMIIEQVTGNSFAQVLKDKILTPYNLNHTFFLPEDTVTGNITKGWTSFSLPNTYDTDASPVLTTCFESMSFTSGALISYPHDVIKFTRLLLSGEILSNTTLDIMRTCTNVNLGNNCNGYGYGLMKFVFNGKTYYGHAGDLSGFTNLTAHNNTDDITLTISINRNNAPRGAIAIELLAALQDAMPLSIATQPVFDFVSIPNPDDMEVDSFGNLWVNYRVSLSSPEHRLAKITADGTLTDVITASHTLGMFGVNDSIIWIAGDWGATSEIYKYDHSGNKLDSISMPYPTSIILDPDGTWYVTQNALGGLTKVNPDKTTQILASGSPLNYNLALARDENGMFYTCNLMDAKVIKIDPATGTKTALVTLPAPTTYNLGFLTYKEGYLYVPSYGSHCIYKVDTAGTGYTVIAGIEGSSGDVNGDVLTTQFDTPTSVYFSNSGNTLFVADSKNNKIKAITGMNGTRKLYFEY